MMFPFNCKYAKKDIEWIEEAKMTKVNMMYT